MSSNETLPSSLRFQIPSTIPQARSYSFEQRSNEASYTVQAGQQIQIDLPRLQRSYLQKTSSLRMTLEVQVKSPFKASTDAVVLDTPGGYSLIDVIEVYDYLGSTLLERIEGVGQLVATLLDTPSKRLTYHNDTAIGTTPLVNLYQEGFNYNDPQQGGVVGPIYEFTTSVEGPISGAQLSSSTSAASTYRIELELPLLSFLGELSDKLAPLHNGYTIMLTLNSPQTALGITKIADLKTDLSSAFFDANISDVSVLCDILELGPSAESLVLSSIGDGPLVLHTKSFRHYSKESSGASAGSDVTLTWPINFNASSVSSILWFMRPQFTTNNIRLRTLSHKIKNNLLSWRFLYGSSSLPDSSGIRCSANDKSVFYSSSSPEAYTNYLKARRVQSSEAISRKAYNINAFDTSAVIETNVNIATSLYSLTPCPLAQLSITANPVEGFKIAPVGRFALGLSTELVQGNVVSGLNTNGMATSIEARFVPPPDSLFNKGTEDIDKVSFQIQQGANSIVPFIADIYMEYDAFISILPHVSTNVSF